MKSQKVNTVLALVMCVLLASLIAVVLLPGTEGRIAAGTGGASGAEGKEEAGEAGERRALPVNTRRVEQEPSFRISRVYTGVTKAGRSVDLAFSQSGRIDEVLANKGDIVEEGEVLAKLDKRRLELQKQKVDDALESGSRGSQVSEIDRDLAELELENTELEAPFAGIVSARMMSVGALASPGAPVMRIVERKNLEVWVGVPVAVADEVEEGESLDLRVDGRTYSTPVTAILPEVDMSARTRTVVFTLGGEASSRHLPGEVVRLTLRRRIEVSGFWVPLTALTRGTRGLWSVYSVEKGKDAEHRVKRHYVEVIHLEGERAWVRGTLEGQSAIVPDGIHRIVPGQRVTVAGAESSAGANEEGSKGGEVDQESAVESDTEGDGDGESASASKSKSKSKSGGDGESGESSKGDEEPGEEKKP